MVIDEICSIVVIISLLIATVLSLLCLFFTKLKLKAILLYLVKKDYALPAGQELEECVEEALQYWLGIGKK